jgi:hypothetical protein
VNEGDKDEQAQRRLVSMKSALADVLSMADEGEEYLIGAMVSDSQACVDARLLALAAAAHQA